MVEGGTNSRAGKNHMVNIIYPPFTSVLPSMSISISSLSSALRQLATFNIHKTNAHICIHLHLYIPARTRPTFTKMVQPGAPSSSSGGAAMTPAAAAAAKAAERLTTQEKLLLAQAVYKLGAGNWQAVSGILRAHPCLIDRPADLFSPESCEKVYVALMTSIEINM